MAARAQNEPVDVLIVGMGASGGTVAKVLSEAGLEVLGVERGPWLRPKQDFSGDELKFITRGFLAPDQRLSRARSGRTTLRKRRSPPSAHAWRKWSVAGRFRGLDGCCGHTNPIS